MKHNQIKSFNAVFYILFQPSFIQLCSYGYLTRGFAPRQGRQNQRAPPGDGKGIDGLQPPVREMTYHPVRHRLSC